MSNAQLRAGLAPLAGDEGQPLTARTYRHPALGDRSVVRLVGERIALAEDHLLHFIGFGEPEVAAPVTRTVLGGLPYPEWALVNDPDNAKVALEAVAGMKRAGKTAVSSPAKAEREFIHNARSLPPTHLPSYYEQAARLCIQAGRVFYGGKMFTLARQMETRHGLTIDDSLRRESYLEFATAGALTVKALKAYFDEVAATKSVEAARDVFEELAIGRIRGGNPPWKEMIRQWKRIAKAAGEDPETATRRLVDGLLDAPAIRTAPDSFWTDSKDAIIAVATASPRHRHALLNLFPTAAGDVWEEILEETGAFAELAASSQGSSWLHQYALSIAKWGFLKKRVADWIPRLASACREPVATQGSARWSGRALNIDLVSLCLTNGIPVVGPRSDSFFQHLRWLDCGTAKVEPLLADSRFRQCIVDSLYRAKSNVIRAPKLREVTKIWLAQLNYAAMGGGLNPLRTALSAHSDADSGNDREFRPDLDALDVDLALARALRGGLAEELRWPAYDEAVAELGGARNVSVSSSWPIAVVYSPVKAIAVGPQGRVAEHDLRIPVAFKTTRQMAVIYSDDAFFVMWRAPNAAATCYWSNDPDRVLTLDGGLESRNIGTLGFSITVDGARIGPGYVLRRGDTKTPQTFDIMSDGQAQVAYQMNGRPHNLSGNNGPVTYPSFIAAVPEGHQLVLERSSMARLPENVTSTLFGQVDGVVGFRVSKAPDSSLTITGVDGRTAVGAPGSNPWGIIDMPYRQQRVVIDGNAGLNLRTVDGFCLTDAAGYFSPPAFWHFAEPSDLAGSKLLSSITQEQVSALIDAATDLPPVDKREKPTPVQVLIERMGFTYGRLRERIAAMAENAAQLRKVKKEILEPPTITPAGPELLNDRLLSGIAGDLCSAVYYRRPVMLSRALLPIVDFFDGRRDMGTLHQGMPSDGSLRVLREPAILALRCISPVYTDDERAEALRLLAIAAGSRIYDDNVQIGIAQVDKAVHTGDLASGNVFTTLTTFGTFSRSSSLFLSVGSPEYPGALSEVWGGGWANQSRIDAFIRRATTDGPVALDEAAIDLIRDRTGLSRTAAALLMCGLPNDDSVRRPKLEEPRRTALKVKTTEVTAGSAELVGLSKGERFFSFYEKVLGTDADLPFDPLRLAERIVEEWRSQFDVLPPLDAEHITTLTKHRIAVAPVRSILAGQDVPVAAGLPENVLETIRWVYGNLPGGDHNIAGVPGALAWVRRAYTDRDIDLQIRLWSGTLDQLPAEITDGNWEEDGRQRKLDAGLFVLTSWGSSERGTLSVRPSHLGDDAISTFLRTAHRTAFARIDWLQGPVPTSIADHAVTLPPGRYAADPRVSAPEVLESVVAEHGFSEDAATLYLQLLTVFNPTDKFLRRVNNWKPTQHKKAIAELVAAGVVIEAKRARAGRSVFAKGGWIEQKSPFVPYEAWKSSLYPRPSAVVLGPDAPYTELFVKAWNLVVAGDGPPS